MEVNNTPTVEARRRDKTSKQRLRAQNGKKIPELAARIEKKRAKEEGKAVAKPKMRKNALIEPTPTVLKHRRRQIDKSWLPTHIFHAKRAEMTPPKEPLWRFAIPLTPTEKSYRITHRASTLRGCVAWDTSYMSTIGVEGQEASLLETFRAIGIPEVYLSGIKGAQWRTGARSFFGWITDQSDARSLVGKTTVFWQSPSSETTERKILVRVHPSAFLQLWEELLKIGKAQKPPVMLEDLRFEIGSIEIMGPATMEALGGVLRPCKGNGGHAAVQDRNTSTWSQVASLGDSYAIPKGGMLSMYVEDPRLGKPHRTLDKTRLTLGENALGLIAEWNAEQTCTEAPIFSASDRSAAIRHLPSQKSINKRKGAALPGHYPDSIPSDPKIPTLLLANNHENGRSYGSWTLLLPRNCVLPVWYCLMQYPLSTGGNPRFGGLNEQRQLCFENSKPWFPGDFPGTKSGWRWELQEREKRRLSWERRPKGKRVEWSTLDLGNGRVGEIGRGWACDWEYLFGTSISPEQAFQSKQSERQVQPAVSASHSDALSAQALPLQFSHLTNPAHLAPGHVPPRELVSVSLTLLHRGLPTICARIYRLPTNNPNLRTSWLALASWHPPPQATKRKFPTLPRSSKFPSDGAIRKHRSTLAAALLDGYSHEPVQANDASYPIVPDAVDLIGFVTTGNFNLGQGRGTGIGCIAWARVVEEAKKGKNGKVNGMCIIREAGQRTGRLARWELVS